MILKEVCYTKTRNVIKLSLFVTSIMSTFAHVMSVTLPHYVSDAHF